MNKIPGSEDEDDIESLRIAALQSLKRKNAFSDIIPANSHSNFRTAKGSRNKWGRFNHPGRPAKSGQGRIRNTNLISITPLPDETDATPNDNVIECSPQDKQEENAKNTEKDTRSKFNRYDQSDKSESESEDKQENEQNKLKECDSLEVLINELDTEIKKENELGEEKDDGENNKEQNVVEEKIPVFRKHPNTRSPLRGAYHQKKHNRRFNPTIIHQPHPVFNPVNQFEPQLIPFINTPQPNPMIVHPTFNVPPIFPQYFDRPISPLTIDAESLTTATRAPLSPRSAAFVLQNKAIIEKRKRSPRRSYSRSPTRSLSRSPRRSLTPIRRSLTPIRRFRRSVSPRRHSRSPKRFSPRKRSLSPKRRSLSPKRRSPSPKRRSLSPKRKATGGNPTKGRPVHDRLGLKSEEIKNKPKVKEEEEPPVDPVLAARRKKFESNELKKKEGIIRLKPKEDVKNDDIPVTEAPKKIEQVPKNIDETEAKVTTEIVKEEPQKSNKSPVATNKLEEYDRSKDPEEFKELERLLNDDAVLEDLLDHKVADIFSDEESASDNEGRFKAKTKQGEKVPVLSFNKLVNGTKTELKTETLPTKNSRNEEKPIKDKVEKDKSSNNQRGRQKITLKSEKNAPPPVEKIPERKIEIKIKHPSKYQKCSKGKSTKTESEAARIPIQSDISGGSGDIIIEEKDDSDDEENVVLTQGDLRTQLSRKRAEKLYKLPTDHESVSSRILQFALHGALFKKSKKSKRKVVSTEGVSGMKGGKLPIHFRLGTSNSDDDIVEDVKIKKKKKRKVHDLLEQV
ncbi:neurofilament heavy polypeptide-like [Diorhabda sublineata]|uniref:neurofilament heavy polypeptide-like n=1 Tax=Diorhabda sublineata TaxID=1163346 RepID=UPI0024E0A887|nr:neurofilament heavy polypeptide-like [Diorhabda sublineata]